MCGIPRHVLGSCPQRIQPLETRSKRQVAEDNIQGLLLVWVSPSGRLVLSVPTKFAVLQIDTVLPVQHTTILALINFLNGDECGKANEDGRFSPHRRKGTVRRKKKVVHKTTTTDDKRLQSTLKRIGVNVIPAIEEVNIFKEDVVIQFINPKVQASIAANTWVVSGSPQTKKLQDILPQIIHQLGPDNLENLKKLAEQFQKQAPAAGAGAAAGSAVAPENADDDEVPDLVLGETFEAAAEEGNTHTS
ncbi:UNVERIFIED_CONTAM: Nascent polypeptide-associated complex subunit beta [Sesamum calycinum]|uniref:Nascent polypeptide-associated complex subunit beta n=1 Tax=Sesamum calycinum TaxID=2727403 RepID=A0AAW2QVA0_9LAMI